MRLKIVQVGEPVLRIPARPLTRDEILSPVVQQLIEHMHETMRDAPGVGLAAPQIGLGIQLAVIEDRSEYHGNASKEELAERDRRAVDFMVLANPQITYKSAETVEFFEGCLSLNGYTALVSRSTSVAVDYLDERAQPQHLEATGWFARILQHEIDHLNGIVYIDRMEPRSFATIENIARYWKGQSIQTVREKLGLNPL